MTASDIAHGTIAKQSNPDRAIGGKARSALWQSDKRQNRSEGYAGYTGYAGYAGHVGNRTDSAGSRSRRGWTGAGRALTFFDTPQRAIAGHHDPDVPGTERSGGRR
jgi:hypothetical protein